MPPNTITHNNYELKLLWQFEAYYVVSTIFTRAEDDCSEYNAFCQKTIKQF